MNDGMEELRRTVELIERKTAIWRSQVGVLLLVFLAGWVASSLWMRASLEARLTKAESALALRVEKTERAFAEKRKTVEAEAFIVRNAEGKKLASFGHGDVPLDDDGEFVLLGSRPVLVFYDYGEEGDVEFATVSQFGFRKSPRPELPGKVKP